MTKVLYNPKVTSESILDAYDVLLREQQEYSAVIARQSFNRICNALDTPNGYTVVDCVHNVRTKDVCRISVNYEIEHDTTRQRKFLPVYYTETLKALLKTRGFEDEVYLPCADDINPIQAYHFFGKRYEELSKRKVSVKVDMICRRRSNISEVIEVIEGEGSPVSTIGEIN